MPKMYKLLTQEMTSYNGMKWEIGKANYANGTGSSLCSEDVLHCYSHPMLAVFFNPIHASYKNPRLFVVHTSPIIATDGCKHGCKDQTLEAEIKPMPNLTPTQRVAFAIKISLTVCADPTFAEWAKLWLSGLDRTARAANAAAYAAARAARAAGAAYAAARAASYAARAADAVYAAYAADAASHAARAAGAAANAADLRVGRYAEFNTLCINTINWVVKNIK